MQVVILAGGLGTRISEESHLKPKPMIEIGNRPILWHIMKHYSKFGFEEFIICCGYKGYIIKEFFLNYENHNSDFTVNLADGTINYIARSNENWKVTLIDTGLSTMTAGRIKRIQKHITGTFALTYGDGVADIDIQKLKVFHEAQKGMVTLSVVQPEGRFGTVNLDQNTVKTFNEKPAGDNQWINGGFMICEPEIIDHIQDDYSNFETDVLPHVAATGQMQAYKHTGFWHSMDTMRDKLRLEQMWETGNAPWKTWS